MRAGFLMRLTKKIPMPTKQKSFVHKSVPMLLKILFKNPFQILRFHGLRIVVGCLR